MTDYNEQLSALMDGELSRSENRFLLKRLLESSDHASMREQWASYHLVGDTLRGEAKGDLTGFADRVMAGIAQDDRQEQIDTTPARAKSGWLWPTVSGLSIAACAVLATVLVIGPTSSPVDPASPMQLATTAAPTVVSAQQVAVTQPAAVITPVNGVASMGPYRNYPNSHVHNVGFGEVRRPAQRGPVSIAVPMFAEPVRTRYTRLPSTHWEAAGKALQERLNSYLISHSEHAASSVRQGPMHYGRLVGYDMSNQ